MTKLTEEERQRLCVAKFRDMSDELLSEMPGTVMELAQKYVRTKDKLDKTKPIFLLKNGISSSFKVAKSKSIIFPSPSANGKSAYNAFIKLLFPVPVFPII